MVSAWFSGGDETMAGILLALRSCYAGKVSFWTYYAQVAVVQKQLRKPRFSTTLVGCAKSWARGDASVS